MVTLGEETDCGRKKWGIKECKFNQQKRIICGVKECEFAVYIWNCGIKECESTFYLQPTLRKNCPYLELFWSIFSRIGTEYVEIRSISDTFCAVLVIRLWKSQSDNRTNEMNWVRQINFQVTNFREK